LLKKVIGVLIGAIILCSLGFLFFTNQQQTTELKKLRIANNNLTSTLEELSSKVDELETTSSYDIESKLNDMEQVVEDLNSSVDELDGRVFNLELWE
jgi:uncharacterized protein HemX